MKSFFLLDVFAKKLQNIGRSVNPILTLRHHRFSVLQDLFFAAKSRGESAFPLDSPGRQKAHFPAGEEWRAFGDP